MEFNADKFLKDYKRMCDYYNDCDDCPLSYIQAECHYIENLADVVCETNKWVEKHPAKTYLIDFREKFPNGDEDFPLVIRCCVASFYGEDARPEQCGSFNCEKCWNREME